MTRSTRISSARPVRLAFAAVLIVVALAVVLVGCAGGDRPGPTALPLRPTATADFDTAELQDGLDELVAAGVPGAVIEVRSGEKVWTSAAGVSSLRSELPATASETFRIASLSKPMTAAIVLQLVDEGEIELDDEFADYVPGPLDDAPRPVTIRDLLQHTSGLYDYIYELGLEEPERIPETLTTEHAPEELIGLSTKQGWRSDPGSEFYYSNTNYIALSMLIERVDGKPLRDSLRERIVEPLGLHSTRLPEGTELEGEHLGGYFVEQGFTLEVTNQHASLWLGAGAIESNVSDINTFMRALISGVVVPPELLAEMTTLNADGYGLGMQGRADQCPDREAMFLPIEQDATGGPTAPGVDGERAEDAPTGGGDGAEEVGGDGSATDPDGNDTANRFDVAGPRVGGAETAGEPTADEPQEVEIGQPGVVYGHLGSGLGYRAVTFTSTDGARQVTIAWNGSPADYGSDPRLNLAYELADRALSVEC